MKPFVISTENTADLPEDFIKENGIYIQPLYYKLGDVVYGDENNLDPKDFYDRMRNGEMPTTMASNPAFVMDQFTKLVEQGYDVLHLGFSSGLSSSYSTVVMCANQVMDEHPGSKIMVIDTYAASMGQGLLVYYANEMKKQGKSISEIAQWVEVNRDHCCHQFTVDDLFHLHRGGRVSKATAVVGTIANIKPLMHVDYEGHLIATGKTRGRKRSIIKLVDAMEETQGNYKNDVVFISHGDCPEDAKFLADLVEQRFGKKKIYINYICPTIGSHSGPGTLALFYMGETK